MTDKLTLDAVKDMDIMELMETDAALLPSAPSFKTFPTGQYIADVTADLDLRENGDIRVVIDFSAVEVLDVTDKEKDKFEITVGDRGNLSFFYNAENGKKDNLLRAKDLLDKLLADVQLEKRTIPAMCEYLKNPARVAVTMERSSYTKEGIVYHNNRITEVATM